MFKTSIPFEKDASSRARSLKTRNFQQPTKAFSTHDVPIVTMNGSDPWKSATTRSSSSKVTLALMFSKVNSATVGSSRQLQT